MKSESQRELACGRPAYLLKRMAVGKVSMLDQIYSKARSLLSPIARHRRLWERAKYSGTKILPPKEGNDLIASLVGQPAAVGKIGGTELPVFGHYLRWADSAGRCEFPDRLIKNLYFLSGVYPPESSILSRFCETFAGTLTQLDVLAVWFNFGENTARKRFAQKAAVTELRALEPYYHDRPWTRHLAGKRVLVVSSFADTIEAQYQRRERVWGAKPEVLPGFELLTLRCPLYSFLLRAPTYPDWFAALDAMRQQMDSLRFDVAIVGAGAWSLPLVAHAKSLGAFAIHLGGAVQVLFGIKGGRWDSHPEISALYTDAWVRPSGAETPLGVNKIEGGCYW